MNIGQLLSSLINGTKKADAQVLELKAGQVVRGTVLKLLGEQEALLNINGVKVHAKLETPLKQGDSTFLTVLPESASGQILLKPMAGVPVQGAGLVELLKALGLNDTPGNRQLVQLLSQSGLPLTKDHAASLAALSNQLPQGIAVEEWSQAAVLAVKRGLPLDGDHVTALRQAIFGKPLHSQLVQLSQLLQQQLAASPSGAGSSPAYQAMLQAKQAVDSVIQLGSVHTFLEGSPVQTPSNIKNLTSPGIPPHAGVERLEASTSPAAPLDNGQKGNSQKTGTVEMSIQQQVSPSIPSVGEQGIKGNDLRNTEAFLRTGSIREGVVRSADVPNPVQSFQTQTDTSGKHKQDAGVVADDAKAAAVTSAPTSVSGHPGTAAGKAGDSWITQLFKSLGLDYENSILKGTGRTGAEDNSLPGGRAEARGADSAAIGGQPSNRPMAAVEGIMQPIAVDRAAETPVSLKAALFQLAVTDDLPAALKETVQQSLQQLTGQQLLLSSDRSSPFTYLTLALPLFDTTGQQTASIHVQSRKSKQGNLDAENCRLLFDLEMAHLGHTLVDVQVVNRIVSVVVHSDFAEMEQVMEGYRQEMAERLEALGYPFLSLRFQPSLHPQETANHPESGAQSKSSLYDAKPYKGVDFRI